ncbi:hypothetical protein AB0395_42930 [Streptosporangium sp. NPDC051023]|uniref:hypothetical protein n=1 Tax=Streptosporangium sp. NPDC051023 TaxID=3155410 RepID=UPI00344D699D
MARLIIGNRGLAWLWEDPASLGEKLQIATEAAVGTSEDQAVVIDTVMRAGPVSAVSWRRLVET